MSETLIRCCWLNSSLLHSDLSPSCLCNSLESLSLQIYLATHKINQINYSLNSSSWLQTFLLSLSHFTFMTWYGIKSSLGLALEAKNENYRRGSYIVLGFPLWDLGTDKCAPLPARDWQLARQDESDFGKWTKSFIRKCFWALKIIHHDMIPALMRMLHSWWTVEQ